MAFTDIQSKVGQNKMTNINQIYSKIPPVKGDLAAQPLPKDNPNKRIPVPSDQPVDSPYLPGKSPFPTKLAMDFKDTGLKDGGFVSTDRPNIYINSGAEAYILEPNGNFKFDGMYDPNRHGNAFPPLGLVRANDSMKIAAAPYSLNPQRIMLPNGRMEYAPVNLRSDEQKENQHMMIYGGKWNKPIR